MITRHKKMVDVTVRLNVGVAYYFAGDLSHERTEISKMIRPELRIKISRSPGFDLIVGVIS